MSLTWRRRIRWISFYVLLLLVMVNVALALGNRLISRQLPVGQIRLATSKTVYTLGEPVVFTLTNNLNFPVYVSNNCPEEPLAVYRLNGTTWTREHAQASLASCSLEQRQVEVTGGGMISGSYTNWAGLFAAPGQYRIAALVDNYPDLPYADFIVSAPAPAPTPVATPAPSFSSPAQTFPTPLPRRRFLDGGAGDN